MATAATSSSGPSSGPRITEWVTTVATVPGLAAKSTIGSSGLPELDPSGWAWGVWNMP